MHEITRLHKELAEHIRLYKTINELMADLGADGEICIHTESEIVRRIMNDLHDIDGGDSMKYEVSNE